MKKFNKNTLIKILKSKELKILIYFIVAAIAFVVIDNYYIESYRYEGKYEWEGPDINGDGEVGDVEGYGYLFGGFLKDIGGLFIDIVGEIASLIRAVILLMPVMMKLICILIQIISIIVKEDKKVLNYVTIIMNLVTSVIVIIVSVFISVFSDITLVQGMLAFDIIISSGLVYYNGKGTRKTEKIDLYTLD